MKVMNVFVSADASVAPTVYAYDLSFLNQEKVTISSSSFPSLSSFQVMIRVYATVNVGNDDFENTIDVSFQVTQP
eukprot:CAMPEP_0202971880 /NCGR_PEP_ID=MMETSP1396-20130829/31832_1 /ASSEMBLY_ACC=CAM_ASM_000872 /TAXON_ID= /ORGANISM="Pseudokeronopsis sp., Strain Brazil" /LENGTH=74 /DNA_ID=CAMNT_0049701729 /DNA_START=1749 /DNA_END=1973 /DNA_ORIENTATION=+